MLAESIGAMDQIAGLGAAGLMGAMWLWERRSSQRREQQLDEAHARIVADRMQIDTLVDVVRQNTQALARLAELLRDEGGKPSKP